MLGRFLFHVYRNGQYDEVSLHCSNMSKAARASRASKVDGHLADVQTVGWTGVCMSVHLVASNTSPGS